MSLARTLETLSVLGDESRLRLCMLLSDRELNVGDLVRVTGLAQSRVSTHLGKLREAGLVRDRRDGAQCFYSLASDALPPTVTSVLGEARASEDPTLLGDRERLEELDTERRGGRDAYSPGRTWQSLAVGIAALLDLGDVLDVGSGDGSAASMIAPYCRSLTCIDTNARLVEGATARFAGRDNVTTQLASAEELPFETASFDTVLVFHTLTYVEHPGRALQECARVLRPGGRLVALCLNAHRHQAVTARYGERHPGFTPSRVRTLFEKAALAVRTCEVASRESKKPHLEVVLAIGEKSKSKKSRP
jgi:SAM-dependent methyltransferase